MKKIVLCLSALLMIAAGARAQRSTGIGVRLTPDGLGFTGKFFMDRNIAFEGQVNAGGVMGGDGESFTLVGLIQYHIPLGEPNWRLYFGGGAHIGSWNRDRRRWENGRWRDDDNEFILGIDAVGGIEYLFKTAPVGLSIDVKPAVNLLSDMDFFSNNMLGFSARYYFRR